MGRTTAQKNGAHVVKRGKRITLLLLGIPPKLIFLGNSFLEHNYINLRAGHCERAFFKHLFDVKVINMNEIYCLKD